MPILLKALKILLLVVSVNLLYLALTTWAGRIKRNLPEANRQVPDEGTMKKDLLNPEKSNQLQPSQVQTCQTSQEQASGLACCACSFSDLCAGKHESEE